MDFLGIKNIDDLIKIAQEESKEEFFPEKTHGYTNENIEIEEDAIVEFSDHFNILSNTLEGYAYVTKYHPGSQYEPPEYPALEEGSSEVVATTYISKPNLTEALLVYGSIEDFVNQAYKKLITTDDDDMSDIHSYLCEGIARETDDEYDSRHVAEFLKPEDISTEILEMREVNVKHSDGAVKPYMLLKIKFYCSI